MERGMTLGKRARAPSMRRTTSLSDLAPKPDSPRARHKGARRNSVDIPAAETAHFLKACGLCRRRLGPGRDTFMYRGEIAFCSLECRQQQMNLDERKEKCPLSPSSSTKTDAPPPAARSADSSAGSETVAAV